MASILLVEDDPFISEIYKKKFELSNFTIALATSGSEVFKKVKTEKFDLILLDLVLPEMSGIEILRELRKKGETSFGGKIVIFSNLHGDEERKQAEVAGADGFIAKTEFTPSEVVEQVKKILGI